MEKEFEIKFDNYIKDNEFDKLPEYKGIYLFRVTVQTKSGWNCKVIYIGRADGEKGLKGRVNETHEHLEDARKLVKESRQQGNDAFLTISYSDKDTDITNNIERIESALIYGKKPQLNTQQVKSFSYDKTIIKISGKRHFDLDSKYEIERDD